MASKPQTPGTRRRKDEQRELATLNDRLEGYVANNAKLQDERDSLREQLEDLRDRADRQLKDEQDRNAIRQQELRSRLADESERADREKGEAQALKIELEQLRDHTGDYDDIKRERDALRSRQTAAEDKAKSAEATAGKLRRQLTDCQEALAEQTALAKENGDEVESFREQLRSLRAQLADERADWKAEKERITRQADEHLAEEIAAISDRHREKLARIEEDMRAVLEKEAAAVRDRLKAVKDDNKRLNADLQAAQTRVEAEHKFGQDLLAQLKENEADRHDAEAAWEQQRSGLEDKLSEAREALEGREDELHRLEDVNVSLRAEIDQYQRILDREDQMGRTPRKAAPKRPRAEQAAPEEDEEEEEALDAGGFGGDGFDDEGGFDDAVVPEEDEAPSGDDDDDDDDGDEAAGVAQPRRSKRLRRTAEDAAHHRPVTRSVSRDGSVPRGSPYRVSVQGLDLHDECVTIVNNHEAAVDLTGWTLMSGNGGQRFRLPAMQLPRGERVTIWSGPEGSKKANPPRHLFWSRNFIWNDRGDSAILFDNDGNEVSKVRGEPARKAHGRKAAGGRRAGDNKRDSCAIM